MKIQVLDQENSVMNRFLAELRSIETQKDRMRFRKNLERIGEILTYEMSKSLSFEEKNIVTPLSTKKVALPENQLVVCSILRAGLSLHQGVLNYFDWADNAFISAYRKHTSEEEFSIEIEYLASPSLEGSTLILADPMLATGRSFVDVYHTLLKMGQPKEIHLLAVIGSEQGVRYVEENFPKEAHLWIASVDENLNEKGYIVPGLGDAGDLAFGSKI